MKYLKTDVEERKLNTREELQEYLKFRTKNDVWCRPAVNETSVVGIGVSETMHQTEDINIPEEVRKVALADNQLLYVFPCNFIPTILPIRYTAFPDICNRAGLKGRTIEAFMPKTNLAVLDPIVKAYFLSTGLSLNAYDCNILIRDEKVSSVKSHEYQIFPEEALINILENELQNTWKHFAYSTGAVSHEYLSVSYLLHATDMEESFRLRLEDMEVEEIPTIQAGVQLSTSDVGNSAVSIAPFYLMDGCKIYLGKPAKIRHDKGRTLTDVENVLRKIGSLFREAEEEMETLGNTEIQCPADCFLNLVNENSLPKTTAKEMVNYIPQEATALDIYIALNKLVEKHYTTSQMSLKAFIEMSEIVAGLMYVDYTKFDHIIEE